MHPHVLDLRQWSPYTWWWLCSDFLVGDDRFLDYKLKDASFDEIRVAISVTSVLSWMLPGSTRTVSLWHPRPEIPTRKIDIVFANLVSFGSINQVFALFQFRLLLDCIVRQYISSIAFICSKFPNFERKNGSQTFQVGICKRHESNPTYVAIADTQTKPKKGCHI